MHRPPSTRNRQTTGLAFGEVITLVDEDEGRWNEYGEWVSGGINKRNVRASTSPAAENGPGGGLVKQLVLEGKRISDIRTFFVLDGGAAAVFVDRAGTKVEWKGNTYIIRESEDWGEGEKVLVGVREDK